MLLKMTGALTIESSQSGGASTEVRTRNNLDLHAEESVLGALPRVCPGVPPLLHAYVTRGRGGGGVCRGGECVGGDGRVCAHPVDV